MKRILFADGQSAELDSIRAMLEKRRGEWHMDFADSSAAAIAAVEKNPYDLLCCDIAMQAPSGVHLLAAAAERWPKAVRIVTAGYAHLEQAVRQVPVAHHYVAKPCTADQFGNVIERSLQLQALLDQPALRKLAMRVKKFPAVPKTYGKLRATLTQPNVAMADVAKIVAADVAVSAKMLTVVNSAFFRLSKQITKAEQAVGYLGFSTVRNLVLSVEVFSQWNKAGAIKCGIDSEKMQSQALLTAAVARNLAAGTPLADDALVAGLLCDVGYLVLVAECPDDLLKARTLSREKAMPLQQAEREVMGVSHAEVGAYLLAAWGFPYSVVEAVAHHHEPKAVSHLEFDLLSLLAFVASLTGQQSANAEEDAALGNEYLRAVHAPFSWTKAQECMQSIKAADNAGL